MADSATNCNKGLVSVVIPVFNRPQLLVEAVDSVLAQQDVRFEILIVDDGSTDETPTVAGALAGKHAGVVQVFRNSNAGPGVARETGRRAARGEFLQYLDSDDLILPQKLSRQTAELDAHPEAVACYGPVQVEESGSRIGLRSNTKIDRMFPLFLLGSWWPTHAPLYRRELLERVGGWLPLRLHEDWEYDCRIAALGLPLRFTPEPVGSCPFHETSRLSRVRRLDASPLRDRAVAISAIARHALGAGVAPGIPEMRHFAQRMFLVSRECAYAGLTELAEDLYVKAPAMAGDKTSLGWFYPAFGALVKFAGWKMAGRLAIFAECLRPSGPGDRPGTSK